jgi:hypothetical protein
MEFKTTVRPASTPIRSLSESLSTWPSSSSIRIFEDMGTISFAWPAEEETLQKKKSDADAFPSLRADYATADSDSRKSSAN